VSVLLTITEPAASISIYMVYCVVLSTHPPLSLDQSQICGGTVDCFDKRDYPSHPTLLSFLPSSLPPSTGGVLQSYNMIRQNEKALVALMAAFERQESVVSCIQIIEREGGRYLDEE